MRWNFIKTPKCIEQHCSCCVLNRNFLCLSQVACWIFNMLSSTPSNSQQSTHPGCLCEWLTVCDFDILQTRDAENFAATTQRCCRMLSHAVGPDFFCLNFLRPTVASLCKPQDDINFDLVKMTDHTVHTCIYTLLYRYIHTHSRCLYINV